ncbi:MAG: hypothetical protein EAZ17_03580 [Sphingobacteriales bacterium]|nr:MAG: hypothetical protein EAZ17_03580 [Sphingobacteriales bacterium]
MAINQNHPFEELDGVKCAVVERNVTSERVEFLRTLLEHNKFQVVVIPSPPPKAAAKSAAAADGEPAPETPTSNPQPPTYTIGVTDVTFNSVNAVYGRLLRTKDGHVVTRDYWLQKETVSLDDVPYYE